MRDYLKEKELIRKLHEANDTTVILTDAHPDSLVIAPNTITGELASIYCETLGRSAYFPVVYPHFVLDMYIEFPVIIREFVDGRDKLRLERGTSTNTFFLYSEKNATMSIDEFVEKTKRTKSVQWHIDPDAFDRKGMSILTGVKEWPKKCSIYHSVGNRNPRYIMDLIRMVQPNFIGLFEYHADRARDDEKKLVEHTIENLINNLMPDVKYVTIDSGILENVPALNEILPGKIISMPNYGPKVENRVNEPDLLSLMRSGRTFGVFRSHSSGVMTYDQQTIRNLVDFLLE